MKCPGQDMQFWNEAAIFEATCPGCGGTIEFYKDDTNRKCGNCGNRMVNPRMDFGCASYCQYAEQCLGTLPEEFVGNRDNLLKDRVAVEVKRYLKADFKRIGHAIKVAQQAEKICREEGGNLAATVCAAYLLEVGEVEALNKFGASAAEHRVRETTTLAETILGKLGAKEAIIQEVCNLIDHSLTLQDTTHPDYRVLADALVLAGLEEENKHTPLTAARLTKAIDNDLLTGSGRQLAEKMLKP
ncbi:MAG: phosphohydrolase [Desulfoprunum sp.]|nr:phosphohydrolase [Desulfoprunum sp.]